MNDLFSYHAGINNPSKDAFEKVKPKIPHRLDAVRGALNDGPLPATLIAKKLKLPITSVRPRLSDLFKAGEIIDTGKRWKNQYDNDETVYRLRDNE